MRKEHEFDWAKSTYNLLGSNATGLADLVNDAGLNPRAGDVSHIDLRGIDLRWEDLRGWDLMFANFEGALIFGANFEGANIEPSSILEAKGWIGARFDRSIRDLLHLLYEEKMKKDLLVAGAGQVLNALDTYLTYVDKSDKYIMTELKLAESLLRSLQRKNEIFYHFVYDLNSEELYFISMIVFDIESISRKEENNYIINICSSILGEEGSRNHTFYNRDNDNVNRHFDAYYHGHQLVIELKSGNNLPHINNYEKWLKDQGLKVITIHKDMFKFGDDGLIKRDIWEDRSVIEKMIKSQLPHTVPSVD